MKTNKLYDTVLAKVTELNLNKYLLVKDFDCGRENVRTRVDVKVVKSNLLKAEAKDKFQVLVDWLEKECDHAQGSIDRCYSLDEESDFEVFIFGLNKVIKINEGLVIKYKIF